jgi:hypothetical protein
VALYGPDSENFVMYLLAIVELLADEQSDDVDWLNFPWFGTLFNI